MLGVTGWEGVEMSSECRLQSVKSNLPSRPLWEDALVRGCKPRESDSRLHVQRFSVFIVLKDSVEHFVNG